MSSRYSTYSRSNVGYSSRRYNYVSPRAESPSCSRTLHITKPTFDLNQWRLEQSQRRLANLNLTSAFDRAKEQLNSSASQWKRRFETESRAREEAQMKLDAIATSHHVSWREIFRQKLQDDPLTRTKEKTETVSRPKECQTPIKTEVKSSRELSNEQTHTARVQSTQQPPDIVVTPVMVSTKKTESDVEEEESSWEEYSESEDEGIEVASQGPPKPSVASKVPFLPAIPLKFTPRPIQSHKEDLSWLNQRSNLLIVDSMQLTLEKWLKSVKVWENDPLSNGKGCSLNGSVRAGTRATDPYPKLQDEVYDFRGDKNFYGKPNGKGVITYMNGDKFSGSFKAGKREGYGSLSTCASDMVYLDGTYTNDKLNGKGKIEYKNGNILYGYFVAGTLHGLGKTFSSDKTLLQTSWYSHGIPTGTVWQFLEGGGCLVGEADTLGHMIGENIAFLYPDHQTALLGTYVRDKMCVAQIAFIQMVTVRSEICQLKFTQPRGPIYRHDPGTATSIGEDPLLADPYESQYVYVSKSKVKGAQEGLHAKKDLTEGWIVAFYNGTRLKETELVEDKTDHDGNAYKILDLQGPDENGIQGVLDIPRAFVHLKHYCASLAHKANHSFQPNAKFILFHHPRFGKIPAIQTTAEVSKDSEIFVSYDYALDDAPPWYQELFSKRILAQYQQSRQMWNY